MVSVWCVCVWCVWVCVHTKPNIMCESLQQQHGFIKGNFQSKSAWECGKLQRQATISPRIFQCVYYRLEAWCRGGNLMVTVYNLTCDDSNCPNCISCYQAASLSLHATAVGRFSRVVDS